MKVVKCWFDGIYISIGCVFLEVGNFVVRVGLEVWCNLNFFDFMRVKDFDFDGFFESVVICVYFYYKCELVLSVSVDFRVNIFRVDGKNNKLF